MAGICKPPWWLRHDGFKEENGVLYEVFKVRWFAWPAVIVMLMMGNARVKERRQP
jgi:hypothetical protein